MVVCRKSADQVENFNSIVLRHALDNIVKFILANSHTLQTELGLGLNQPCLNVVGPEGRTLDSNSHEKVCSGEDGGSSIENGRVSRQCGNRSQSKS